MLCIITGIRDRELVFYCCVSMYGVCVCWLLSVLGCSVLRVVTKVLLLHVRLCEHYCYRRHVLKFMMTSPLGYHVHMCSTVNFVFGDEETVMPQLTQVGGLHNSASLTFFQLLVFCEKEE